jgi:hypothetical protein
MTGRKGRIVPLTLGYLRRYTRWNGDPGVTLRQQREKVTRISHWIFERKRGVRIAYYTEAADGAQNGWPVLRELMTTCLEEPSTSNAIIVIPTLDGVRFNTLFLELLKQYEFREAPAIVFSGVSPSKRKSRRLADQQSWNLDHLDGWLAFQKMIEGIQDRRRNLSKGIKAGLRNAAARGEPLGAQRGGAHRFSLVERIKGGRATAVKRQSEANEPYRRWINEMRRKKNAGQSLAQIARWLAAKGARTRDDKAIGPMLVWRILNRD